MRLQVAYSQDHLFGSNTYDYLGGGVEICKPSTEASQREEW